MSEKYFTHDLKYSYLMTVSYTNKFVNFCQFWQNIIIIYYPLNKKTSSPSLGRKLQ